VALGDPSDAGCTVLLAREKAGCTCLVQRKDRLHSDLWQASMGKATLFDGQGAIDLDNVLGFPSLLFHLLSHRKQKD
jgi:hypothetical protein